ncbi:hypothetical protein L596_012235 [Steinernema carpocapsae]|uniref:CHK kinase-like domain-containing protein n=1 Tax=Steinernema carpocapsae TaxID=34508 RepID=A0A4U5NWE2_STECR|nr:hypothetical protein L596_012235 [Steinernema carpocapsae]
MAQADSFVAGSHVTLERLMRILEENDKDYTLGTDPTKFAKAPTENCISGGKGFASKIFNITLESEGITYSVLIKYPSGHHLAAKVKESGELSNEEIDAKIKEQEEMLFGVHNREVAFYEFVKKHVPDDLRLVKYIYGEKSDFSQGKNGFLLMEDLSPKTMKQFKLGDGLEKEQVYKILDNLAILQARSVVFQAEITSSFPHSQATIKAMHAYVVGCCEDLEKKNLSWFSSEISRQCKANADPTAIVEFLSPNKAFGDLGAVLVHGDLWPNNMIFQERNGKPDLLAIVDWQCTHAGNFSADIAAVLAVSMDPEERRKFELNLLGHYVDGINYYLAKFGSEKRLDYGKVRKSYKNSLKYAILQMIMTVATNPQADVSEVDGEGPLTKRLRCLVEDIFL